MVKRSSEVYGFRAYLAVLNMYKYEVVLLMGSVPIAISSILDGFATALVAVGGLPCLLLSVKLMCLMHVHVSRLQQCILSCERLIWKAHAHDETLSSAAMMHQCSNKTVVSGPSWLVRTA